MPPSPPTSPDPPVLAHGSNIAPIQVLLIDDHPAVRMGARQLIDDQPDMRVVAEASSADEALGVLPCTTEVAIVDFHLGAGRDGLWLTAQLKRLKPAPRVLIYSAFADAALAVTALLAGADGLLGKEQLGQVLCRAIRVLARGQHYLPAVTPPVAQAIRSRLEPRDQAIFGMLLHGMSTKAVAERLGVSADEVHVRREAMLRSLTSTRTSSALPSDSRGPLDYERPKRRPSRRAA